MMKLTSKNSEGTIFGDLDIKEVLMGDLELDYFVVTGGEIEAKDSVIDGLKKNLFMLRVTLAFLCILFFVFIVYTNLLVTVAIAVLCGALSLDYRKAVMVKKNFERISARLSSVEHPEVYIVAREKRFTEKAREVLKKLFERKIESQESLILPVKLEVIYGISVDVLLLVGFSILAYKFLFLSLMAFIIIGVSILYFILEILSKYTDLIRII